MRTYYEPVFLENEPLEKYSTWRIGGPAEYFYIPACHTDCIKAISMAKEKKIPITFLGAGSNVLIADEGIKGLVLLTRDIKNIKVSGTSIIADSGVSLMRLSRLALKYELTGMEFAAGIPGTLGGAVIMNAGAHGSSMAKIIEQVKVLSQSGEIKTYNKEDMSFDYRSSKLKGKNELVLQVTIRLENGDKERIKSIMERNTKLRRDSQPLQHPNAGSIYRNPPGESAGRLIESIGAKGWNCGDAQVSEVHANFIVNKGHARAKDVLKLMGKVENAVYNKYSIELKREVVLLGCYDNRR